MDNDLKLTGFSGTDYWFRLAFPDRTWNGVPGLYVFYQRPTTPLVPGRVLYIGETESFASRMPGHERWAEAVRLGATGIWAAFFNGTSGLRQWAETDLIRAYRPPMNEQHNRPGSLLASLVAGRR